MKRSTLSVLTACLSVLIVFGSLHADEIPALDMAADLTAPMFDEFGASSGLPPTFRIGPEAYSCRSAQEIHTTVGNTCDGLLRFKDTGPINRDNRMIVTEKLASNGGRNEWHFTVGPGDIPNMHFTRVYRPPSGSADFKYPLNLEWNGDVTVGIRNITGHKQNLNVAGELLAGHAGAEWPPRPRVQAGMFPANGEPAQSTYGFVMATGPTTPNVIIDAWGSQYPNNGQLLVYGPSLRPVVGLLVPPNQLGFQPNSGAVSVANSAGVGKALMFVDSRGRGIVAADRKNFRMNNPLQPETDIWYSSLEGPEVGAYIRGTATLIDGRCAIDLPDHFHVVASPETLTVQLTPLSA